VKGKKLAVSIEQKHVSGEPRENTKKNIENSDDVGKRAKSTQLKKYGNRDQN